jgi:hypothetical protein
MKEERSMNAVAKVVLAALMLALAMTGCRTVDIEKGVPVSIQGLPDKPADTTGKAALEVRSWAPVLVEEFYASENGGLFFLQKNAVGVNADNAKLFSFTGEDAKSSFCWVDAKYGERSAEKCREALIRDSRLVRASEYGNNLRLGASERTYVIFKPKFNPQSAMLTIEYLDYSKSMIDWKAKYEQVKQGGPNEYIKHADEFKGSPHSKLAMTEMFTKFFNVKVVSKHETPQRPIKGKGLITSYAGSCKDITRRIEISPKSAQLPSRDIQLDTEFILRRTYKPLQLEKDDDPIALKKSYVLEKSKGFTLTDDITYECVMTSTRIHAAGLTLMTKVLGMEDAALATTTLTDIGFDIDVLDVK